MKYMTFNSSCSYAGIANLLSFYGIDTEDRTIALEMGLPFLFDYQDGCYLSGPMLQSAKWFNLYLQTVSYTMMEKEVKKDQICAHLRHLQYAMLGIYVSERNKHAVVYTGMKDGKFCMLNNKWEHSNEPDTLLLSEQELLRRVDETVVTAVLEKSACETVKAEGMQKHSIAVLQSLGKEIAAFCSQERSAADIRSSMDPLFRAILLDAVTMLDLLGETRIRQKLKTVQGQFLNAVKANKPLRLDRCLDITLLNSAITEYISLIRTVPQSPRREGSVEKPRNSSNDFSGNLSPFVG